MQFNLSEILKKYGLLFVVFITGACVLVIEVVANRILSPYYGNTIFTVSGVISIVLLALSLGYYIGGKIADKNPFEKLFYFIIFLSGLSVFVIYFLNLFLLPWAGYVFSIIEGPIIFSLWLFFFPSLLLGTLSPFVIKLQEKKLPEKGIGSISGEVFFWSTLGSIFGSLFTGFFLIPNFGVSSIILTVAIVLLFLGLFPVFIMGISRKTIFKIILILAVILVLFSLSYFLPETKDLVYKKDGVYEKITIYDGTYREKPARFLRSDQSFSAAMFLGSEELVFDYTKYYSVYKALNPNIKKALVIGGGAYSIPKALLSDSSEINVDVCEIEPELFDLAKKYFKVSDDPRLKNYVQDGRRFLYDTEGKYDFIFSDVYYSLFSIPIHFTTEEFFQIVKDKLNKNGVFVANIAGGLSANPPSFLLSEMKTFKEVFENSYFFAVNSPNSLALQNVIFVAYNSDKIIDFNSKEIKNIKDEIVKGLSEKIIDTNKFDLSLHQKLTDNFCPVEYLVAREIFSAKN